jgi:tRNA threonylcarbamoyladenosine biosynthesis protein TsaE
MISARTTSAEETRALAAALADYVVPGDLVVLSGDLGAGKTAFCQGFGMALGVTAPITSPTFTLHHRYRGRVELNHIDVYRFDQLDEVVDLALAELLDSDAVTVIEWGDTIRPALPADYLEVSLQLGEEDDERSVTFRFVGARWLARARVIGEVAARWPVPSPDAPGPPEGGAC